MALRQLLRPALTDRVLDLLGPLGAAFDPLLHNTVNATIIRGGEKVNVIPSEITVELDGRLVPGCVAANLLGAARALATADAEVELISAEDGAVAPHDLGLYPILADVLRQADPGGVPIPMVLAAVTDARFFAQLGIQTYGYIPMRLLPGFDFAALLHAADERARRGTGLRRRRDLRRAAALRRSERLGVEACLSEQWRQGCAQSTEDKLA